jgi:hypothetical protein
MHREVGRAKDLPAPLYEKYSIASKLLVLKTCRNELFAVEPDRTADIQRSYIHSQFRREQTKEEQCTQSLNTSPSRVPKCYTDTRWRSVVSLKLRSDLSAATIRKGSATFKIPSVFLLKRTVLTSARNLTPVVRLVYGRCIGWCKPPPFSLPPSPSNCHYKKTSPKD